jgi:four helix bundle protein
MVFTGNYRITAVQRFNCSTYEKPSAAEYKTLRSRRLHGGTNFRRLASLEGSASLTQEIYRLTRTATFSRDFSLTNQMQRAAISKMSNIAEGYERGGNQEFSQFLYIAKGSCGELRAQLYLAFDQGYVTQAKADELNNSLKRLSSMISNLSAIYVKAA